MKRFIRSQRAQSRAKRTPFARKEYYHCKTVVCKAARIYPRFPGTNCEYDTARVFEAAGAVVRCSSVYQFTPNDTVQTLDKMARV